MRAAWPLLALVLTAVPALAQTTDAEFFESKIRPVLATRCYGCHSSKLAALHQLGMDHTRLTYRYAGRDFRLTDVYGEVVKDILA